LRGGEKMEAEGGMIGGTRDLIEVFLVGKVIGWIEVIVLVVPVVMPRS